MKKIIFAFGILAAFSFTACKKEHPGCKGHHEKHSHDCQSKEHPSSTPPATTNTTGNGSTS